MLGEIKGYALIKIDSKTGCSAAPMSDFEGRVLRVLEFGVDGCVLVINAKATAIATFDKCDIKTSFKCAEYCGVICPEGLTMVEILKYAAMRLNRKGGYGNIVKQMVIAASLNKGELTDNFLFQKD